MNYEKYVTSLVEALGGAKNVGGVTHCATRLRFLLIDKNKVNKEKIESLKETVGTVEGNGTFQVIIGTNVGDVYDDLIKIKGISEDGERKDSLEDRGKQSKFDKILDTISAIFTPYIPVLASAGIIKGLLALMLNIGWLTQDSNTYAILSAAGNSLIYFFPILLAFTAARKFGANPYIGAAIGAALLEPNLTKISITGNTINFVGINFVAQSFENTVIPIILGMWAFSYLEKGLKKVLPSEVQLMVIPLISLVVMVPAILLVFGPIGFALANGIAFCYEALLNFSPILMGTVFGALFIYVIMLGMHWIVLPIQLGILAGKGMEFSLGAGGMGNYALLGVCLAVFCISKDKQVKAMAGSASFVNLLSGITEPGLYGIVLKNKKYFIALTIAGTAGGFICGLSNFYITNFAFTGLFGIPAYAAAPKAIYYFIAVAVTISVSFVLTIALEKGIKPKTIKNTTKENITLEKCDVIINNPVSGEVVELSKVNDTVFSTGTMGKGVGIVPNSNSVVSPIGGEITLMFHTKHAIGITAENGVEILIHVGIDTVRLEGKYFESFVEQGQKIKAGDKLIEFDREKIMAEQLDTTVMVIVTNSQNYSDVKTIASGNTEMNEQLLEVIN